MTYAGEFNISGLNTVRIPNLMAGMTLASVPTLSPTQYSRYYAGNNIHSVYNNIIKTSTLDNPLVWSVSPVGTKTETNGNIFTTITPNPINGFYYNFSTSGSYNGVKVYKASVFAPTTWIDTGYQPGFTISNQHLYIDSNKIWLISGATSGDIYSAPLSNPLNITKETGTMPSGSPRDAATSFLTTVGTKLYLYKANSAAFSANVSDPNTWSISGANFPLADNTSAPVEIGSLYNDGSFIYLFSPTLNGSFQSTPTVYKAAYATPTTFTVHASGALPSDVDTSTLFVRGSNVYINTLISNNGTIVYKANSDLTVWTPVSTQNTPVKSSHVILDKAGGKVYTIGGMTTNETTRIATIQSATLPNIGEWKTETTATPPAAGVGGGELIKTRNGYYIVGGNFTGVSYRASLANPLVWSAVNTSTALLFTRGKCCIIGDYLYYFGGESSSGPSVGVPKNTIYRVSIDASNNDALVFDWRLVSGSTLPINLSRFALIRSGAFIYLIGGYSTGSVMNNKIYRANIDTLAFTVVGTLSNSVVNPSVSIVNNYAYLSGGGTSTTTTADLTTVGNSTAYASMSELASGIANFVEENTTTYTSGGGGTSLYQNSLPVAAGFAESVATCINDRVYFIGGRSGSIAASPAIGTISTSLQATHVLTNPNSIESNQSVPTIDRFGASGVYSSFQKTGYLPWLIFDSTSTIKY